MTDLTPRIGISLGDPGGIGPEVIKKAISSEQPSEDAVFIVYAPVSVIKNDFSAVQIHKEQTNGPVGACSSPGFYFHEIEEGGRILPGGPSKENGLLSYHSFIQALEDVRRGRTDALVTAPISKHSWSLAGISWAGHTDYLRHLYPEAMMTFWSRHLKVALFTHHIPLRDAVKAVTRDSLYAFIRLLDKNLDRMEFGPRRILVAGLNPHAGEEGLLGTEEKTAIRPAIDQAREQGIPAEGPFPPDIVFRMARGDEKAVVVGLYHDQGLIAFKWAAFEEGVNATLGLPFLRTSPDHGTAFDISGQGCADPSSMIQSLRLARRFAFRLKKRSSLPERGL
jgi:4-hydroxythreonine-4-phosphate dehydrogenase